MSTDASTREVWNIVRSHDQDRYLSALFAPAAVRDDLMVLYAFSCEVARIPRIVSEPMLGEIRLQWWRDAIARPDDATGNLLADELNRMAKRHRLPCGLLTGMIDARSFDLGDASMPDMQALSTYLGKTDGVVFALAAQILNGAPPKADQAAREAGIALGLARLLCDPARSVRLLAAEAEGEADSGEAVFVRLRARAMEALMAARMAAASLPKALLPAFLPAAMVEPTLRAARRSSGNEIVRINPLSRHWRMWRAMLRGRF